MASEPRGRGALPFTPERVTKDILLWELAALYELPPLATTKGWPRVSAMVVVTPLVQVDAREEWPSIGGIKLETFENLRENITPNWKFMGPCEHCVGETRLRWLEMGTHPSYLNISILNFLRKNIYNYKNLSTKN